MADFEIDVEEVLDDLEIDYDVDRGSHGWVNTLCPIHEEKHPSFGLNYEHGGWVDRHTGETGSLVMLVERIRDITREEAIEWVKGRRLSSVAVMTKLQQILTPETLREIDSEGAGDLMEWWERYERLDPRVMAKYFFDRGFKTETMVKFEVRYDEEQRGLIWPVRDQKGAMLGMAMRKVDDGDPPYLYNEGFPKRGIFFPLNFLTASEVVLVEGPLDAMWLHQCGVQGALCTFGSMSRQQAEALKSLTGSVVVAFDDDEPGREMANRIIPRLANHFRVRIGQYPEATGMDPQDLSPEQVREFVMTAAPLLTNLLPRRR